MRTNHRALSLAREMLYELSSDDLDGVVGGQAGVTFLDCVGTELTDVCTHGHTCGFCVPTFPVNGCLSVQVDCPAGR